MSMEKKVITAFLNRFSGTLYSLLLFGFLGLSFLNSEFNFDLPKNAKIRDTAPVSILSEIEKISNVKKPTEIVSTFKSSVPRTASPYRYITNTISVNGASNSNTLTISNPRPTDNCSYISPFESGVLSCNEKFMYAHSSEAFNGIKNLSEGGIVTVYRDGSVETYKIEKMERGMELARVQNFYIAMTRYAQYRGESYDLILMTCGDGTYGPNGNNNAFRTLVFARRIG